MSSSWKRGRVLSAKSWSVLREHPSLLKWPVIGLFAGLPGAAVFAGGVVALGDEQQVVGVAAMVLGAYLAVFSTMLCSAALVAGADQALRGETPEGAFGRATQHLGAIAGWALIQTVVGWLLQMLSNGGSQGGGDRSIVLSIVRALVGGLLSAAWSLITFFVLPLVVLEGLGPVAAIRRSAHVFKERWGTQLMGSFRIGGMIFLVGMLPSLLAIGGGVALIVSVENGAAAAAGAALIGVGVLGFLAAGLVSSAMRSVFGVALLHWAQSGEALGPFDADELQGAVRSRDGGVPAAAPVDALERRAA